MIFFFFFFFFFLWGGGARGDEGGEGVRGGCGPFRHLSLISSRSFIKNGRKPENPGKTTRPSVSRTWFSHM